jgi:trimeric autotransporter adhesin
LGSTVGGGVGNTQHLVISSTVSGGYYNTASGYFSTVGGGTTNTASGYYSSVLGGCCNITNSRHSSIGGGHRNIIQSPTNECCSRGVTIGGGIGHNSSGRNIKWYDRRLLTGTITFVGGGGDVNPMLGLNAETVLQVMHQLLVEVLKIQHQDIIQQ